VPAWFDPTSDVYFTFSTGAQVSDYVSRIGAQVWSQATSGNQMLRALAGLNGRNLLLLDGVNDFLGATANPNFWKFCHDGTGFSVFAVLLHDVTGTATSSFFRSASTNAQSGIHYTLNTTSAALSVFNASGSDLNAWVNATAAHYARGTARWQMLGYVDGFQHSRVSGSSLTNADVGGQNPSVANPSLTFLFGNGASAFKGYVGDLIFLNHIATAGEQAQITSLLAQKWGVAA
jgi:hypothetical protein